MLYSDKKLEAAIKQTLTNIATKGANSKTFSIKVITRKTIPIKASVKNTATGTIICLLLQVYHF